MRLRKKPWVGEALKEYSDFVITEAGEEYKGRWREIFGRQAPLHVEVGTGKGKFISEMAEAHPEIVFIGIEAQQDVLYYAAKKVREKGLTNVRLLVFDVNQLLEIFAPGEISRLYINFCDPWPKARHAKRRLTHRNFLDKYRVVLDKEGEIHFKTDNRPLFEFSLEEFAEQGLATELVTFDLHASDFQGNIMTEYETKFSSKGTKICRCQARF